MARPKPEKTQRGNPHQLTVKQHIHSAAAIRRFAGAEGNVAVARIADPNRVFSAAPEDATFCARRAWDQHLERGLFRKAENRFQAAVDAALRGGTVDHEAVTEYAVIWTIRDVLNCEGDDVELNGIEGSSLSRDEEEILEQKGYMFVRKGGLVPAHIGQRPRAMQLFDMNCQRLAAVRWRVGYVPGSLRLVCPDAFRSGPTGTLPIDRQTVLVALLEDGAPDEMTEELVRRINAASIGDARSLVFGHPDDLVDVLREHGERLAPAAPDIEAP